MKVNGHIQFSPNRLTANIAVIGQTGKSRPPLSTTVHLVHTSRGQTLSDDLATRLCEAAIEAGFHILNHTKCPAVLTENLFQDAKAYCDFLLSAEGKKAIKQLHVQGIISYVRSREQEEG